MEITTILAAIDFSRNADCAFSWALAMAGKWSAKVIVLYVAPMLSSLGYSESLYLGDLARMEREGLADAERQLQEFVAKTGPRSIALETRVILGEPGQGICDAARREHADLIVVGSHGRTGLAHVFLGSVAERVVRYAPCPVLVVRSPKSVGR